jgi:hypothetical protein
VSCLRNKCHDCEISLALWMLRLICSGVSLPKIRSESQVAQNQVLCRPMIEWLKQLAYALSLRFKSQCPARSREPGAASATQHPYPQAAEANAVGEFGPPAVSLVVPTLSFHSKRGPDCQARERDPLAPSRLSSVLRKNYRRDLKRATVEFRPRGLLPLALKFIHPGAHWRPCGHVVSCAINLGTAALNRRYAREADASATVRRTLIFQRASCLSIQMFRRHWQAYDEAARSSRECFAQAGAGVVGCF